jgi:hypothetical protein
MNPQGYRNVGEVVARSDLAEVRHHANSTRRKNHQITCTQSIAPYSSETYYEFTIEYLFSMHPNSERIQNIFVAKKAGR